jgi:hypothetical protein
VPRYGMSNGCFARTRTSLGAPPTPRLGVSEAKRQSPDAAMRARERDGLFDIVRVESKARIARAGAVRGTAPSPSRSRIYPTSADSNCRTRASPSSVRERAARCCCVRGRVRGMPREPLTHSSVWAHTIEPSPARGEGTKGTAGAFWPNEPNCDFGQTNPTIAAVDYACPGCGAAQSGAPLMRDRHGLERSTQVGFTRLAHIGAPISGKPEIGVCRKTGKFRDRTNRRGARGSALEASS